MDSAIKKIVNRKKTLNYDQDELEDKKSLADFKICLHGVVKPEDWWEKVKRGSAEYSFKKSCEEKKKKDCNNYVSAMLIRRHFSVKRQQYKTHKNQGHHGWTK